MSTLWTSDDALAALVDALRARNYAFTTVTPATHAHVARRMGDAPARSLRDVLGWSRPFAEDLLPPDIFGLMREAGILVSAGALWRATIRLSSLDGELFVHAAYPPTAQDAVFFGPDTMRFVACVTQYLAGREAPVRRAVDIGCGSGAAGIAVAKRAPGAEVLLVDINPNALRAATLNARLAGVTGTVPVTSDLLAGTDGAFDLVVSNPPFMLDAQGRTYRHGGGEFGEGLSLAVVEAAAERLNPRGALVLFTGSVIVEGEDPFREAALTACARAGLSAQYREYDPDAYGEELADPIYARADRIALAVLVATREA
ncbi:methyltransferase [Methylobacterium gregans]|uniref:Release factor glutamine methyltransferase n=1 Tax=Methylobacterium gregans TaxID=374424 RepID=A0AA37HQI1_9HYPH|nr:class I SAM-dependent methyltransferase [Methylobacterium gregans]MDQ0518865.1 SAM-dependent methyltransferase [Methylobacterium gregans]GJD79063.1 Release factor glutamine methyltransferase [Methylobacterium gregans]GLS56487.1 hypothetical protein GCM10007886_46720 [Methylobacterium gregans]